MGRTAGAAGGMVAHGGHVGASSMGGGGGTSGTVGTVEQSARAGLAGEPAWAGLGGLLAWGGTGGSAGTGGAGGSAGTGVGGAGALVKWRGWWRTGWKLGHCCSLGGVGGLGPRWQGRELAGEVDGAGTGARCWHGRTGGGAPWTREAGPHRNKTGALMPGRTGSKPAIRTGSQSGRPTRTLNSAGDGKLTPDPRSDLRLRLYRRHED